MYFLIFLSVVSHAVASQGERLQNVHCQLKATVIATDEPKFAHYPYYVTLHRCTGSWGRTNPSIIHCVPSETKEVKIRAIRLGDPTASTMDTITLVNHTKCTAECVVKASQCSKYENYDSANCRCYCPHRSAPVKCPAGMMWDSHRCQCACISRAGTCPSAMVWSDKSCSCACPAKSHRRCRRNGKVLDRRTCACVDKSMLTPQKSAKNQDSKNTTSYWFYIVVGEFFVMLLICDAVLYRKKTGMIYSIANTSCRRSGSFDIKKPEIVVVNGNDNESSSCRSSHSSLNNGMQETRALLSLTPTQSVEHL